MCGGGVWGVGVGVWGGGGGVETEDNPPTPVYRDAGYSNPNKDSLK